MKTGRMTGIATALLVLLSGLTVRPAGGIVPPQEPKQKEETCTVHFIDVGQGDATLICCGGASMLIDTGDDTKGTLLQHYLQNQGVRRLDYLVLTHPDSDHIGGAPVILTKFETEHVLLSDYEKDNKIYQKLRRAMEENGLKGETPAPGSRYALGSASFTILGPTERYDDPNNASLIVMVQNGENRFLFTGDAEEEAEADLLRSGCDLRADVYQAGHHGSRTSSSEAFLDAVDPDAAVISCGEDNAYGHPHAQTLNTLRSRGVKLFRTDEQGSVTAASDGQKITWNCAPTESWKAGEPTGSSAQTGESKAKQVAGSSAQAGKTQTEQRPYVLNVKTGKFHRPECSRLPSKNRKDVTESREVLIEQGYDPCAVCQP